MKVPLEDGFQDVLGKALHGRGEAPGEVAERAGVTLEQMRAALSGQFDEGVVRAIARVVDLNPDALAALGGGRYVPEVVSVEGLAAFNTPFDDMTVNAYLVWDPASQKAAAFDTGSDVGDLVESARERGLEIEQVFITHSHGDHIYDLDRLIEKTRAKAWAPQKESVPGAEPFEAGRAFKIGNLDVETRLTWGHSKGGVTYVVRGLERPLAICGDAMFAGSMGGGGVSYADALRTNRKEIFTLPDETVLCPGHGPLTTVGEQRVANPFFLSV